MEGNEGDFAPFESAEALAARAQELGISKEGLKAMRNVPELFAPPQFVTPETEDLDAMVAIGRGMMRDAYFEAYGAYRKGERENYYVPDETKFEDTPAPPPPPEATPEATPDPAPAVADPAEGGPPSDW